jgi:pSer/pThr/pTyr-binding forkhead associated (FHA) protein
MTGKKNDYYPLDHPTITIGRSENLEIQVIDEYISRRHLQISYNSQQSRYYALDLNSRHGTIINGRKIKQKTTLADGDQIRIGDTTILFTEHNFTTVEIALEHFKKTSQYLRPTAID